MWIPNVNDGPCVAVSVKHSGIRSTNKHIEMCVFIAINIDMHKFGCSVVVGRSVHSLLSRLSVG